MTSKARKHRVTGAAVEFEGRSSLKTRIFRILMNQAKRRGQREGRQIPFSAMWRLEDEPDEPAVEPDRFIPADALQWGHHFVIGK